jgi:hypothetical protein
MRRRRLLLGAGLLALLLGVAGLLLLPRMLAPKPGVTLENFRRIRRGMTLAEVEAAFGRPADERVDSAEQHTCLEWAEGQYCVTIVFEDGLVEWGMLQDSAYPITDDRTRSILGENKGILNRLCRLLPFLAKPLPGVS